MSRSKVEPKTKSARKPDPRNNADDAFAAFMSMSDSEWAGCYKSVGRQGIGLMPLEQVGFIRALGRRGLPDEVGKPLTAKAVNKSVAAMRAAYNPSAEHNKKLGEINQQVAQQGLAIKPAPVNGTLMAFDPTFTGAKATMVGVLQGLTACVAMSNLTVPQKADLNTYLLTTIDTLTETQKHMRARVLDELLANGVPVGEGGKSKVIDLGNGTEQRAVIMKSGTDPKKLYAALSAKSPTLPTKYMRQTIEYDLGGDKGEKDMRISRLVQDGVFTIDELGALEYEPTYRVGKVQERKASNE